MTTPEEIAARREAWEDDADNRRPDYPAADKTIVTAVRDLAAVERERDELRAEVERLSSALTDNEQAYAKRVAAWGRAKERAEKAAAKVARVEALAEVAEERARQDAKWGQQDHSDGTGPTIPSLNEAERAQHECDYAFRHGVGTWRHILAEEVAEAFAESEPEKLRAELIQIAAVAAAWVEAIDRRAALEGGDDE